MSLERRRDPRELENEDNLKKSTFSRDDFTPLGQNITVQEEAKIEEQEDISIVKELSEIEQDVLNVAKEVLKLKRYDAEFEIETEREKIQKWLL